MSIYTTNGLQLKPNKAQQWTVMCREQSCHDVEIDIPGQITGGRNITRIGHEAFQNDAWLMRLRIPPVVGKIGHHAFTGCHHLKNIMLSPTTNPILIRESAFDGCDNLKGLCFLRPTSIEQGAFANCSSLVLLDGQINFVGNNTFQNCRNLKSVNFHKTVTIEDDAFLNCNKLKEFTFFGDVICSEMFLEKVLKNVKIACTTDSNLAQLAYAGYCVEVFEN